MALNPIGYTERIVRSFLRYQLTTYPFADPRLREQMRTLCLARFWECRWARAFLALDIGPG